MIICGWGQGVKRLGEGFFQVCAHCNNTNRFVVAEKAQHASVFFVPVAKWWHEYFYVCPICTRGWKIPSLELAQRILAGAFRDPTTPDSKLISRLDEAMLPKS